MPEEDNEEQNEEIQEIFDEIADIQETNQQHHFDPVFIELGGMLQPRIYVERTYEAILQLNDHDHPTVFQKSGKMVRIGKMSTGARIIQDMDKDILFNALTYRINYFKRPSRKAQQEYQILHPGEEHPDVPQLPPADIVTNILTRYSYDGLPELIGIVSTPIINLTTGAVRFDSHYDPVAQMYYGRSGIVIPPIPENPTKEEVDTALELLKECVVDFPFVTTKDDKGNIIETANRTNMISLLITSVIRPSIPGNIPIFLIDKPSPGTGAGLLCDTVSLISTGECARVLTIAKEEEWKKVLVSVLKSGNLLSIVDNVEGKVDLPTLAAIVTAQIYSDRALGGNTMFTTPHRLIWILNGNNVELGGDLPRRVVGIRMNSNLEHPWLRPEDAFTHPNQIQWVTDNRGRILSAIFTIVRGWILAGATPADCKVTPMGSFEGWRNVIGGIMQYLGYTDFLENANELLQNTDVDAPQWNAFISNLFDKLSRWNRETGRKDKPPTWGKHPIKEFVEFTSSDIIDLLQGEKDPINIYPGEVKLQEVLPDNLADEYVALKNFNRVLGNTLRKHIDRVFDKSIQLEKTPLKRHQAIIWRLTIIKEDIDIETNSD